MSMLTFGIKIVYNLFPTAHRHTPFLGVKVQSQIHVKYVLAAASPRRAAALRMLNLLLLLLLPSPSPSLSVVFFFRSDQIRVRLSDPSTSRNRTFYTIFEYFYVLLEYIYLLFKYFYIRF